MIAGLLLPMTKDSESPAEDSPDAVQLLRVKTVTPSFCCLFFHIALKGRCIKFPEKFYLCVPLARRSPRAKGAVGSSEAGERIFSDLQMNLPHSQVPFPPFLAVFAQKNQIRNH